MAYDRDAFWQATDYAKTFRRRREHGEQEASLTELLQHLKPASVLDVACGFGRLAPVVRAEGATYTGIDISATQIQAAVGRLKDEPDVWFRQASVDDLPLEPAADVVLAFEFLMHVSPESVADTITHLKRLCRVALITCDWDRPFADGRPIANHNFLHDYRRLFGPGTARKPIGPLQGIYLWHQRRKSF